jgi:hypothetical protein
MNIMDFKFEQDIVFQITRCHYVVLRKLEIKLNNFYKKHLVIRYKIMLYNQF